MKVNGDYAADGYAHVEGLIPPEVAEAFLRQLKADLPQATQQFHTHAPILKRTAIDIYARDYPPMLQFLWGLTPAMRELTQREVLPTYNYFRIYRQGDICRVHSDRPACEHSLSLTLGYSDALAWPFEVGRGPISAPGNIEDGFGAELYAAIAMQPGDAVLYRGVEHRHGRIQPNPNRWSAHMFLHYVDRDGPHAAEAFDAVAGETSAPAAKVDFDL
ncbi:MAG: hypothetical protein AB7H66_06525 [Hyphomonadaceae bacterium]